MAGHNFQIAAWKVEFEQLLFFIHGIESLGLGIRDLESEEVVSREQGLENEELQKFV